MRGTTLRNQYKRQTYLNRQSLQVIFLRTNKHANCSLVMTYYQLKLQAGSGGGPRFNPQHWKQDKIKHQ